MDIKRDEAFEEAYAEICKPIIRRPYPRNQNGEYVYKEIHEAHLMWQEAQAQQQTKLNLLLCTEHLEKCESPTGIFNSKYPDEEPCLICFGEQQIKKVQKLAVPDGYMAVPKSDLMTVLCNCSDAMCDESTSSVYR